MTISHNIVLIPAYEPGPSLLELLRDLSCYSCDHNGDRDHDSSHNLSGSHAHDTSIIVVDDGSGPDYAHGQHRTEDAMKICAVARTHPDALVLGGRRFTGKIPLRSRFGNAMTRLVYRLSTGLKVYDTQTGLRAFHKDLLPRMLGIPGDRYEYEMNVLLDLAKARTPIIEEEIETIYLDNNSSSHFDTVRDSLRVYREILRFSASSFAGFLIDYAMYSALILATGSLRLSNIAARVVSSSVNYTLNRKFVFRSSSGILRSALSYYLLAAAILAGNTLVLEYLVGSLGIGRMFAKILTELLFFAISWSVQRSFIFKRESEKGVVI